MKIKDIIKEVEITSVREGGGYTDTLWSIFEKCPYCGQCERVNPIEISDINMALKEDGKGAILTQCGGCNGNIILAEPFYYSTSIKVLCPDLTIPPKHDKKHLLTSIGFLSGYIVYLDLPLKQAVLKYIHSYYDGTFDLDIIEDHSIEFLPFDDTFEAYEVFL